MRRPVLALLFVAVLGAGGVALAGTMRAKPQKPKTDALGLPTGADTSLPVQGVGVATGYAQSQLIDTGPVNYDYIDPKGWGYVVVGKDW